MGDRPDPIRAAGAVDADWLTDVLHAAGIGHGHRVVAMSSRSIGTGQVGENVRFELAWSDSSDDLPASVVGKFPSLSDVSRGMAVQLGTYVREVGFYRDLQHLVDIRTPHVHHVGWDPDTHDFVVLMEDVRDSRQGDQLAGCTVEQAAIAVAEAVGLHAPTWGRDDLLDHLDWVNRPDDERTATLAMLFGATLPGFCDRYRDRLDQPVLDVAARVVEAYPRLADRQRAWASSAGAWCVVHADYRLDNLLFGAGDAAPPVTVVDWQTVSVGSGPGDIAYFLGAGLLPAVREQHERELVAGYAAALRARGIDVADDAVWDGYVLGSPGGLLMAILASQVVERTERGDEMFMAMASRHAAQVEHVGLFDLI